MNEIICGLSDHYNWLPIYTTYVVYEYERYISLYSKYNELTIAPDAIEQCWMYHVLNIEHYYNYCKKRFNRVILFKPENISPNDRNRILHKTRSLYLSEFGGPKYEMVWISHLLQKIHHDRQKLIIIKIKNKSYKLTPTMYDTVKSIKENVSLKSKIGIEKIVMFIEGTSNITISQLFRVYNYKESKNLGFCKEKPLYDNFLLLDIYHYGFTTFIINII